MAQLARQILHAADLHNHGAQLPRPGDGRDYVGAAHQVLDGTMLASDVSADFLRDVTIALRHPGDGPPVDDGVEGAPDDEAQDGDLRAPRCRRP